MSSFVFTGKGVDSRGVHRTRDEWATMLRERGHSVFDRVDYGIDYLVASRTDTTKAQAARRCGTDVITYAVLEEMMGAPAPSAAQRIAERGRHLLDSAIGIHPATGLLTQSEIDHADDIWRFVSCNSGPLAGDLPPVVMDRKPGHFDQIESTVTWRSICALANVPQFTPEKVYPRDRQIDLTPFTDFSDAFAMALDRHSVYVFILTVGGQPYLVNTEGYNYCRYAARIVDLPFAAPPVPEPMVSRPRRAIRL